MLLIRLLVLGLCLAVHAAATQYEFLKISNVVGESTVANHVGEIDVVATQNYAALNQGQFSATIKPGRHTPVLAQAAQSGTVFPTMTYTLYPNIGTYPNWVQWRYTYTNVKIVQLAHTTSTDSSVGNVDNVSFSYDTVKIEFFASSTSTTTTTSSGGWNISSNKSL